MYDVIRQLVCGKDAHQIGPRGVVGTMMDITFEIEGLPDRRLVDAIRRRVHVMRRQFDTNGEWRLVISPSETRGEWDVGVRAPSGWHLSSFGEALESLPMFIDHKLREYVRLSMTDTPDASIRAIKLHDRQRSSHVEPEIAR